MPAIYEHHLTVAPGHIDRLGHVNNLEYLRWALEAAVRHSAAQGWPAEAYERLGATFVVRSHEIQYLQPAYEGDEIVVRTWVADFRRLSCLRRYKIIRTSDDVVLAKAATQWSFIKLDSGTLTRIPPELGSAFEIVRDEEK
jgi:acyl-CoA thioester hydrolase